MYLDGYKRSSLIPVSKLILIIRILYRLLLYFCHLVTVSMSLKTASSSVLNKSFWIPQIEVQFGLHLL